MIKGIFSAGIILLLVPLLPAQTSTNYKIEEFTFNNGGNPSPVLSSASYSLTLDAVGDALAASGLASSSYGMSSGFSLDYPPPGEVLNLRFSSKTQFGWNLEPSGGKYNTYRGTLGSFTGFGSCLHGGLATTTDTDTQTPAAGSGYFYLVTAENRLNEEGIKGRTSGGAVEPNPAPCP
jgi:hypothetical protein